jgi:hypothetical protein
MNRVWSGVSVSAARITSFQRSSCQSGTPIRSMRARRLSGRPNALHKFRVSCPAFSNAAARFAGQPPPGA